ncbi:MAG: GIY-YIG nuclease family protein [Patescibacteria group bacterium]
MFYVYVLFCADHKLYIGFSEDLKRRIDEHQKGRVISTKHRRPLQLIYYECYCNGQDAKAREVYLKSGGGHREFKKQNKNELKRLGYQCL